MSNSLRKDKNYFKTASKFLAIIITVAAASCHSGQVEVALQMAGENRGELEKVLDYFEKTGDKEKISASRYLIKNMPGHKSMRGDYKEYWEEADRLLSVSGGSLSILDSLESLKSKYNSRIYYDFDLNYISADYLIQDIETAFKQWREGEWARHLTFDDFCEWLLPYTCTDNQPLMNWRDSLSDFARGFIDHLNECDEFIGNPRAAITRVNNKLIPLIAKQKWVHSGHGFPIYDPSVFVKLPGASCDEYMNNGILIMRSKGIPVGMDYTPQFSDRKYGHYWNVFPNMRGRTTVFTSFGINPDYPHYAQAKFAKIFRRTYAPNKDYLALLNRNSGKVPRMYDSPFFKDVTSEYQETSDLEIVLKKNVKLRSRDVYIAVFDNSEWKAVLWGRRRAGKALFKGMGRNITYMVFGYENETLVPISEPFFVDSFGNVSYIGPSNGTVNETISFRLYRKYPMFQHVMLTQPSLHGGLLIGSDDKKFSNPDTVSVLPDWELTSGVVPTNQRKAHRYWRFVSDRRALSDMAELYLYEKNGGILNVQCNADPLYKMFDGDPLTYFSARREKPEGIIDVGKPVELEHISYIRRGDGNAIVPGDTYRVSWWNGAGWTTHCVVDAEDVYIQINDIPADRLYYIEGLSRGEQNRIFTYSPDATRPVWR